MNHQDKYKTKDQFIHELNQSRQQLAKAETGDTNPEEQQEALIESEKRYRSLVDTSPIPIFIHSEEKIVFVNHEAVKVLGGNSSGDFIGKSVWDLIAPAYLEEAKHRVKKIYKKESNSELSEFKFLRLDGEEIIVEVVGTITDYKGKPASQVVFRDITQQKQAEKDLKIQKIYLEELFESSPDAIAILDNHDRVLRINREFQRLFGYTEAEAIGQQINHLIVPEEFKDEASILTSKVANNEYVDTEGIRRSKTGERIEVSIRGKPFIYGDNQLAVYGIYSDISIRKQAEAERQKLEDQLRQTQKMEAIGSLASGIAHDFNNILSAIMGYTELASLELPDDSGTHKMLENVLSAAERAKDLVKQILLFSRKDERERESMYLENLLKEALKLLRATVPTYIEIRSNIAAPLKPVLANATQINQVVMNICTNAAHAMRDKGGILEINLKEIDLDPLSAGSRILEPGRYQLLTFSDTGHGMKPEILERIFEPYFTTKEKEEGTGLGLAVVHGIIKNHGGDITAYSEPERGTTFNVYLPVTEQEQIADRENKEEPIQKGSGRILFVDDDPSLLEVGKLMLEGLGYQVVTKGGSLKALETFQKAPHGFDLVITDQTMPHMTGDQLAVELKRLRSDIPIVLCTGFSERVNEENFKAQGIDVFLMKPLVRKEISRIIHNLIESK